MYITTQTYHRPFPHRLIPHRSRTHLPIRPRIPPFHLPLQSLVSCQTAFCASSRLAVAVLSLSVSTWSRSVKRNEAGRIPISKIKRAARPHVLRITDGRIKARRRDWHGHVSARGNPSSQLWGVILATRVGRSPTPRACVDVSGGHHAPSVGRWVSHASLGAARGTRQCPPSVIKSLRPHWSLSRSRSRPFTMISLPQGWVLPRLSSVAAP